MASDQITVVNAFSGSTIHFPSAHHSRTTAISIRNNSLISSNANTITHWDFQNQKILLSFQSQNEGTNDQISDVKFVNDKVIVSGGNNCYLNLFDLRANKNVYSLKVTNDNINKVEVKDGLIYLTSNDGYFGQVDLRNEEVLKFKYKDAIIDFALFDDKAINLFESGNITVVDLQKKELLNEYNVANSFNYMIKMDYHLNKLVIGSEQGDILQFNYSLKTNMITKESVFQTASPIITHVKILDGIVIGVGNDGLLHRFSIETR